MREEKVSEKELSRAKKILISQDELAMQTHSSQALDLGINETYDLGQDFGNKYIQAIKEIDAAKVRQAARKYILPEAYVMVAVGAGLADKTKEPGESTTETPEEANKENAESIIFGEKYSNTFNIGEKGRR